MNDTLATPILSQGNRIVRLAPPYADIPGCTDWLNELPERIDREGEILTSGRHRVVRIRGPEGLENREFAVKIFGRQLSWKDWYDKQRGTKAARSFNCALALRAHSVGTPEPVACMEQWQGRRLQTSFLVTQYEPNCSSFRDELIQLYRHEPDCEKLMALLQGVARAIAALHRAGWIHRDLGNQNILLRRLGPSAWGNIQFIDLNRARAVPAITSRDRALDLGRITLPSDLLRIFLEMYNGDQPVPPELKQAEARQRARFDRHTRSRAWRHPLRTAHRRRQRRDEAHTYPPEKELWIWDERSGQAISTLLSRDRKKNITLRHSLGIAHSVLTALPQLHKVYREECHRAFTAPVAMNGRVGIAVHPRPETWKLEREQLEGLGTLPVLIRFYHHESEREWAHSVERVKELSKAGYPVSIALIQDRRATREPARWDAFVRSVLDSLAALVEEVEIGHAINRVKWGIWSMDEYARLWQPLLPYQQRTPRIRLTGPAVIDFEYHYLAAALDRLRGAVTLDAISHHLYVDRRGAPENPQGGFALVEKCALARAIARIKGQPARLIVSEVNWPLTGTGVYSPVNAPYILPNQHVRDLSVDEHTYGDYLLRYVLNAICSGLVERVFWWRLVAHGYGVVDDRAAGGWRPRPAYAMLRTWLQRISNSDFLRKEDAPEGIHAFLFRQANGNHLRITYAHPDGQVYTPEWSYQEVRDAQDNVIAPPTVLTGRPVYWC